MTISVNLKRLLDRKQWEMCNFAPASSTAGSFIVSSNLQDQYQYLITSATSAYLYDPFEDGWETLPSPALVGAFGAASCGVRHPWGPRAFATGGTSTTMTTGLNLQRSLKGYTVRFIAGPNAGTEATIKTNTTGTNSTITFTSALTATPTAATEFILITGRVWVMCATNTTTNTATGTFRYYDVATNTWNSASVTGLPTTWGTDARLVATPSITNADAFVSGTATSATSTTLVNSGKTWTTNNWANYQVRITGGTGAGQFRTIASNTATTLTVSAAWTTTPDSTSTYVIEGNCDNLYLLGNSAVTMYRYSLSGNSWTTLAPTAARTGSPNAGMSGHWVNAVSNADWNDETNFLNGRYIYSFRANGTATLDRYDIALNTWESDIAYAPKSDTFASGTGWSYATDYIYAMQTTGRLVKYNIYEQRLEPCSQLWYAQGTVIAGDRMFDVSLIDGATKLRWLYFMTHTQTTLFRILLF